MQKLTQVYNSDQNTVHVNTKNKYLHHNHSLLTSQKRKPLARQTTKFTRHFPKLELAYGY